VVMLIEKPRKSGPFRYQRSARIIVAALSSLSRQLILTAGLVVLAALIVFAFDLDALLRFLFRFSAQYVESSPSDQSQARQWILVIYAGLNIGLLLLKSLNLVFGRNREGREQP